MRAEALAAAARSGDWLLVATAAGPIGGVWRGRRAIDLDEVIDVELEVPGTRDWSQIVSSPPKPDGGGTETEGWLEGVVLELDEIGALTIDVAGSPVLVDTTGPAPSGLVGKRVWVRAEDLEFHPTSV